MQESLWFVSPLIDAASVISGTDRHWDRLNPFIHAIRSAYEVKNNSFLFERLFKVKKNGVFILGISFFFLDIYTFLYYANEESDDVIGGSTKTVQHSIMNISRNIGAVFFKLGTRNVHHKRESMTSTVLLSWQYYRLQSLSVKNQICPFSIF